MVIIGVLVTLMVISWAIVTAMCVLSSRFSREEEQRARLAYEPAGQ